MTDRADLTLSSKELRAKAHRWIDGVPAGTRITFKGPQRSLEQNDKLWAMLTDVSSQLPWHGLKLSPADWKLLFLDALSRDMRMVPNLDGDGFVALGGRSSSDLSKAEMSELIELIFAFGAQHGVIWRDPAIASEAAA